MLGDGLKKSLILVVINVWRLFCLTYAKVLSPKKLITEVKGKLQQATKQYYLKEFLGGINLPQLVYRGH